MFTEQMNDTIASTFLRKKPVKGEFGIEIETEGAGLFEGGITKEFNAHLDGSLRHGMEYVSIPLYRKDVALAVLNLKGALDKSRCILNPSYRSSTHLHQNYLDNTWSDVIGSIVGWTIVEPVVFEAMPPGRSGSLFCMSSFDTGDATAALDAMCEDISSGRVKYGWNYRGKYSSQNLLRLADLGTIEYRVFPTSMDGIEIDKWCGWLEGVKTQAVKAQDRSFLSLVEYAEKNPIDFCGRVFEGNPPVPVERIPALIDFGSRHAYELARVVNEHINKPAPKVKKKKPPSLEVGEIEMEEAEQPAANFRPAFGEEFIRLRVDVPAPVPVPPQPAPVNRNQQQELDEQELILRRLEREELRFMERVRLSENQVARNLPGAAANLLRRQQRLAEVRQNLARTRERLNDLRAEV